MGLKMNVLTFCLALVIESRRPRVAGFVSTIKEWGFEKNDFLHCEGGRPDARLTNRNIDRNGATEQAGFPGVSRFREPSPRRPGKIDSAG
jgi:hypothetical protein